MEQPERLWPADKVERRRVADLVPYARNARTHNEQQVAQVAASIREWGWTIPILIDEEGGIIAGHCRVMAANKLKIDEVPCMTAKGWTEAQKRAYVLADNKLALNAGWDEATLAVELQDIQALGFDQLLTGFSENEIKALSENGEPAIGDPDEIPNTLDIPVTRLGDKWTLGKHVMLCGDSTDKKSVSRLMGNKRAHICLTDPPYGIGETKSIKNEYDIHDDTVENLRSVISGFLPIAQTISDVVVLTPGNWNVHKYPEPKWTMAWFTPAGVGRGPWGFCCWQPILCYGSDPKLKNGNGCHPDAIVHTESSEDLGHPCAKPIKFWSWLMERTTEKGNIVYDPFCGSGTTIIAAETLGRICFAMEISPAYCDIIITRWQNFTGKQAILHDDGRTFDEIAAEREPKGDAALVTA